MHARVGVATPVLLGELRHDTSRQIAGGNESIRVDERSRPFFHMNEAVINAMGSKARSLGLGVIANAIVAGQLSPFDLAALARLGHLPQVKAASILAAGREADTDAEPWGTLLTVLAVDAKAVNTDHRPA
jgi:hypothetical protein